MMPALPYKNNAELIEVGPNKVALRLALIDNIRDTSVSKHTKTVWRKAPKGTALPRVTYQVGNLVKAKLAPNHNKLAEQWAGPPRTYKSNPYKQSAHLQMALVDEAAALEHLAGARVKGLFSFQKIEAFLPSKGNQVKQRGSKGRRRERREEMKWLV